MLRKERRRAAPKLSQVCHGLNASFCFIKLILHFASNLLKALNAQINANKIRRALMYNG